MAEVEKLSAFSAPCAERSMSGYTVDELLEYNLHRCLLTRVCSGLKQMLNQDLGPHNHSHSYCIRHHTWSVPRHWPQALPCYQSRLLRVKWCFAVVTNAVLCPAAPLRNPL